MTRLSRLHLPLASVFWILSACADDVVAESLSTESETGETGDGDGDPAGDGDGDPAGDGDGDIGDGDGDIGDGDGDIGDGDGDIGDGDGDIGDGDGDIGDGDGDIGDGDGDIGDGDGDIGDGDGDIGDGDGDDPDDELCLGPIFVDIDAPPDGDGLSWATAFDEVQAAIDAAAICENPVLWVAEGIYAPDPAIPVALIINPVSIFGGFAGNEVLLDERDIDANPTQLGALGWQSRIVDIEPSAINFVDPVHLDGFILTGSEAGAIEISGDGDLPQALGVSLHNLEVTDNSAAEGAGLWTRGWIGVEIVNAHFEGNQADERGAAIFFDESGLTISESVFLANESPGGAIHQISFGGLSFFGHVIMSDSLMSANVGGAMKIATGNVTNSEFSANSSVTGGAIEIVEGGLRLTDCLVLNNTATNGGAIYLDTFPTTGGSVQLIRTLVEGNTASASGGALFLEGGNNESFLSVVDSEFRSNVATAGDGGAMALFSESNSIENTLFVDNRAERGGAVFFGLGDTQSGEIRGGRFVGNEATVGDGGGLFVPTGIFNPVVDVINSDFVANLAAHDGGGAFGRADYVSSTFANNIAGNVGDALAAPAGDAMSLRAVVAWPDDVVVPDVFFDHACVPQPMVAFQEDGLVILNADPFEPDDLDVDGLTEFYLLADAPCVDAGGVVGEFDPSVLTTRVTQCTDADPLDAGVHYLPQFDAGPC